MRKASYNVFGQVASYPSPCSAERVGRAGYCKVTYRKLRSNNTADASRLLGSATTLLTLLSNPLNVTLLTSQLLSAPSIWQRPDGLRTTIRIFSIFNSAAIQLVRQEETAAPASNLPIRSALSREEWGVAVIKGLDDRSPRWRHLCVLAGLLMGFEGRGERRISNSLRRTLESATVKATKLALQGGEASNEFAVNSIAMMLSHIFDLLSDGEKTNLDHDLLLPILVQAPFFTKEGLHNGYFLTTIDADVVQSAGMKFDWSSISSTYVQCQRMATGPLIASLGSLSRLTAFSVENVQDIDIVFAMIKDLSMFTRSLCVQWRQNKLSEIDITEEAAYLSEETLRSTLPLLWRVLKSSMFAIVIVLRSLLGRVLGDARIAETGGMRLILILVMAVADQLQLLSWPSKHSRFYATSTLSPRAWERTPSLSTHLSISPSLISSRSTLCNQKLFSRISDLHQLAPYHSIPWIAAMISISSTQPSILPLYFHLSTTNSY